VIDQCPWQQGPHDQRNHRTGSKQQAATQPARVGPLCLQRATHFLQGFDHQRVVQLQRFQGILTGGVKRRNFAGIETLHRRQ